MVERELGDTMDIFTLTGDTLTIDHTRTSPQATTTSTQVFVKAR